MEINAVLKFHIPSAARFGVGVRGVIDGITGRVAAFGGDGQEGEGEVLEGHGQVFLHVAY